MTATVSESLVRNERPGPAPCPICRRAGQTRHWARAQDVEYYTSLDWFDYFRCEHCDVIFLHPLPVGTLAEIYPPNYYSYVSTRRSLVQTAKKLLDRRRLRRILQEIQGDSLRVLDVGGGTGEVLNLLRGLDQRVKETEIVDLDPGAETAARASGHAFTRCRIEDFAPNCRYDLILLLNLIEHVEDPVEVLKKAGSLLAPGGRILIKTPNVDSLDARLFRHRSWGGYHCPRHWTLFTPESFSAAAVSAGLKIRRISFTQGAPFWAISVFNLLRDKGWVRSSADFPAPFHPVIPALQGFFALVDLLRSPVSRTSQIFVELSLDRGARP
jgi:SAM-dependent methyltransferase